MKIKRDDLGTRMKGYEQVPKVTLMRRTPVVLRLDGKAFHTFTKGLERPFDQPLHDAMLKTTEYLTKQIQGAVFGYTQSDEISILLSDWASLDTDSWLSYQVQKIVSISASMATAYFNNIYSHPTKETLALFDCRAFNIPFEEAHNYFVWRQQDATRNSVQTLGQAHFSPKELHGKNNKQIQEMLINQKDINWNDLATWCKRGASIDSFKVDDEVSLRSRTVYVVDHDMPVLTTDTVYIGKHLK